MEQTIAGIPEFAPKIEFLKKQLKIYADAWKDRL